MVLLQNAKCLTPRAINRSERFVPWKHWWRACRRSVSLRRRQLLDNLLAWASTHKGRPVRAGYHATIVDPPEFLIINVINAVSLWGVSDGQTSRAARRVPVLDLFDRRAKQQRIKTHLVYINSGGTPPAYLLPGLRSSPGQAHR